MSRIDRKKRDEDVDKVHRLIKGVANWGRVDWLFDPVQTHAVYQVHPDELDDVKSVLKENGATYFRILTAMNGNKIVCFSTHKMFLD
jgi:hypothetical protein